MSLFGDGKETKNLWTKATTGEKWFLFLSSFLSATSIATLAESIIKWRGFIRTGVEFYDSYFIEPICSLFDTLNINISVFEITSSILLVIAFRAVNLSKIEANSFVEFILNKTKQFPLSGSLLLICMAVLFAYVIGYITGHVFDIGAVKGYLFLAYFGTLLFLICSVRVKSRGFFELVSIYNLPFILVGIAAAINKGLSA
ncbi:hypothetical protein [Paraglaciecola marina]|uniref:hypothetical protein n=1 Tax=Paraglaciecola marina TaxID=2500157 RepID=UPI00105D93E4|nr:hypothetical protein [Paraglaciecola marina]